MMHVSGRQVAVLLMLIATESLSAQRASSARRERSSVASDPIRISVEQITLPSGLRVILSENHSTPRAVVDVWYHVGWKNDVAGKSGFAHLFEHVMFTGSAHA